MALLHNAHTCRQSRRCRGHRRPHPFPTIGRSHCDVRATLPPGVHNVPNAQGKRERVKARESKAKHTKLNTRSWSSSVQRRPSVQRQNARSSSKTTQTARSPGCNQNLAAMTAVTLNPKTRIDTVPTVIEAAMIAGLNPTALREKAAMRPQEIAKMTDAVLDRSSRSSGNLSCLPSMGNRLSGQQLGIRFEPHLRCDETLPPAAGRQVRRAIRNVVGLRHQPCHDHIPPLLHHAKEQPRMCVTLAQPLLLPQCCQWRFRKRSRGRHLRRFVTLFKICVVVAPILSLLLLHLHHHHLLHLLFQLQPPQNCPRDGDRLQTLALL